MLTKNHIVEVKIKSEGRVSSFWIVTEEKSPRGTAQNIKNTVVKGCINEDQRSKNTNEATNRRVKAIKNKTLSYS